jgi:putative intracellular protease/amidase
MCRDAGVDLTLASQKVGQPPIDPKSDLPENQPPAMARFKTDTAAQEALANTPKLADAKAEDFETVFYPGGNGPMYQNAATEGGTATKCGNKLQCCKTLAAERWQSG